MTNERPIEDARCWLLNTADMEVAVHVNYHGSPLTTIKPEEDQPAFTIDSDASGIYGTYTFEAVETDDPDDTVLASVSVLFEENDSYAAVFRQVDDAEYEFSVYENDFSPSGDTRFEIRHTGLAAEVDWTLEPKPEADPSIPDDERSGTLQRGEWQQAIDVTENEYRLEVLVDGEVVAFRQDLELEANRMIVVYLVGDPKPWMGSDEKEGHIFRQEYQIQTGEHREDEVTPPADPYTETDDNQTIEFDLDPVELYHTNRTEVELAATDPDGIVDDLAIESAEPYSDGFVVPDESVDRAFAIGGETTATLLVKPKVPPASYEVDIVSNPGSLGERAVATLPVEVAPVTVDRLQVLVDAYHAGDEMTDAIAAQLTDVLEHADEHRQDGETAAACSDLKQVIDTVGEHKDEGISEPASLDIETEAKALRAYLSCG
ncbi:FIMAH domain-containing protein [Haloarchaeobius litoreus]|uniref:FIMAH domain-containing protein n=1 Tax=Haloarchaeobius litoreus TaxID=755306 RepID=A0ABD6DMZ5_9EURY|nr:hypothetical protein [Haloarchaeobius litoreus]